ncbi:DsbA family oxidoreductase [Sphingobium nicotianae]|uniref:DsbA family oxidoreductase n=1 Tax=Sphingobium nicotianae TaxID=2782607 RepID=A0A9X1DD72_9SPHN|nr:DsbA family oxidoreductase [Sphingobium nicotianae]MBT2187744.1 DsbA family oxidoreductase [Sphingobium nicotianae]
MPKPMKIDFVSDIACPWCAIGLGGLEQALVSAQDAIDADLRFQPFELNPDMPAGGQNVVEHLGEKYGSSAEQSAASRQGLIARAREVGFDMAMTGDSRLYNTFDAHRLLHWAGLTGHQRALKKALFAANFTDNRDIGDPAVLADVAEQAGLDRAEATDVLASGRYADEVRNAERLWQSRGIRSVPAIVINDTYLISGGQPAAVFEQALREIAAKS